MGIQIIPQSGFASSLGSGLGQGISEQIPKEVERLRLQSGLKGLGDMQGKSLMEQMSALFSVPGMTPQIAQTLAPLLQERLAQRQGIDLLRRGDGQQSGLTSQGMQPRPMLDAETIQQPVRRSTQELQQEAAQAFESAPEYFQRDPKRAVDYVEKLEDDRIERESGKLTRQTDLAAKFDDTLQKRLGTNWKQLGGDVGHMAVDNLRRRTMAEGAREGEDVARLTERFGDEAEKLMRSAQRIQDLPLAGKMRNPNQISRDAKTNASQLLKAGVPYQQVVGAVASSLGIDRAFASALVSPDSNPSISYINSITPESRLPVTAGGKPIGKGVSELTAAAKVASLLRPQDSIGAIVHAAREVGLDAERFRDELTKLRKLEGSQLEQASGRLTSPRRSLSQFWLELWRQR
jgi:hypothetical protein